MSQISKNKKVLTVAIFAALAVVMVIGPLSQTMSDNTAFAKSKHKENKSDQGDSEKQSSDQGSQCVAGDSIILSCNNFSSKDQLNTGNNALGQQNGNKGTNNADQNKDQAQSNSQNSQCVSGDEAIVSCNNVEFQNLINSGNNALGQK
jgi:hypothetical protein